MTQDRQDDQSDPGPGGSLRQRERIFLQVSADQAGDQVQGGARQRKAALVDKLLRALGGTGVLSSRNPQLPSGASRYAGIRPGPPTSGCAQGGR